ncbi:MAG TPA: hypothetical protein VN181_03240, partial [Thermoanaerobaculia bacterium]|nr:hypothetical protein [Thermoanaerobaculia bacterium]
MSKTANISAQIEDEHNRVIAALIATAVAPPLAQFRETSIKALRESSKEAIDAAQELIRHTDGVAKNMAGEIQTYARQVRDAADGLADR